MPPLPAVSDLPDLAALVDAQQLAGVQQQVAALRAELGLTAWTGAPEGEETPVGDLSAELSRRLAGMESPLPEPEPPRGRVARLKSYGPGEYGAALRAQQRDVSFEATMGAKRPASAGRLGRLKSYMPGEYAAILAATADPLSEQSACPPAEPVSVLRKPGRARADTGAEGAVMGLLGQQQLAQLHMQQKPGAVDGTPPHGTPPQPRKKKIVRTLTPHGVNDMVEIRMIPGLDASRAAEVPPALSAAEDELSTVMAEVDVRTAGPSLPLCRLWTDRMCVCVGSRR